jgi:membrane-bound lytic murein transglycosylase B
VSAPDSPRRESPRALHERGPLGRRAWLAAAAVVGAWALLPGGVRGQAAVRNASYTARADVQEFIADIAAKHGLERDWIERVLAQGRYSESAERLTTPGQLPAWTRNWLEYRARNVDARRIDEGSAFARAHREALERAELRFGVPPTVIVAIIGIESQYGRMTGRHRTLDVLLTLAFDYTRRAALYRDQLTQFLLLCDEQSLDPLAQRGSFAGALGLPQFMPGSIRRFAIDFDADGRIDLMASAADAIGSVGNFLYAHGWERDTPVHFAARADAQVVETLGRGIRANHRWQDVAAMGVHIDGELPADASVLLIDLPLLNADGDVGVEYRLGTVNLSALLHYNRSYFYAAAVTDLAFVLAQRVPA